MFFFIHMLFPVDNFGTVVQSEQRKAKAESQDLSVPAKFKLSFISAATQIKLSLFYGQKLIGTHLIRGHNLEKNCWISFSLS